MADPRWPVYTVRYKTYLKEAIVEALQNAFVGHPDDLLRSTEVVIEFPMTEAEYPAVVVRFYGRSVNQAGVAHHEFLEVPRTVEEEAAGVAPRFQKFRHLIYTGDLEFAVYALSSYDRDLIGDTLVEILQMGDLEPWTNELLKRVYQPGPADEPADQEPVPWGAEDQLLYRTSLRMQVMGEFYSRVLPSPIFGLVERVDTYPYQGDLGEPIPDPHPDDPSPWQ
jgi:hypothetical protein